MELYSKCFFDDFINNGDHYYAHLPKAEQENRSPELLSEHSALVFAYAKQLAVANNLTDIIKKLVVDSIPDNLPNKQLLAEKVEYLFWRAIAFHDLGKVNKGFQKNRMKNMSNVLSVNHSFENQHSVISVYLYLADFFSDLISLKLTDEEQILLSNIALYMSYPIYKHHSSTIEQAQNEENWDNESLFALKPFLSLFKIHLIDQQIEDFHKCLLQNANFDFLFDRFNNDVFQQQCSFPLYALVKLNYSLLTAADYLATAHYMNNWKEMLSDFGLINDTLRNKIVNNAQSLKPYNKAVFDSLNDDNIANSDDFKEQSNVNLNELRKCIAMEVVANTRKNVDKSLFYIEAPTGSGKTNVSMLALSELLKANSSIQKVFYVFPFTTLITQTYQALQDTLGLEVGELTEIHSKAATETGRYEDDYLNYLDKLFMNYPITLLSHVSFFDVLKTNHKEANYLLHRFANSVVIIDEIQSYAPKIWGKIVYFIANYAKYFNMKFIVMSATLPKIGDIIDRKELTNDFVYLVSDKNKYFKNPNFCNRVLFDYSLLEWNKPSKNELPDYLNRLSDVVIKKSNDYSHNNSIYPNSVFTIIEFIFKKTASEFYSIVKEKEHEFDEILLLSGTILEPRRKEIIAALKSKEMRSKKILLITTQVVEAGVDIDMDLGFKDKSLIDSEEQLAGRINRNVNKPACKLYVFDCNAEKTLYGNDDRYKVMREMEKDKYGDILNNKDFDRLYQIIIDKIKKQNKAQFIDNINDVFEAMATLNFRDVDNSLKIISQQNVSVFVPISIDVSLIGRHIEIARKLQIDYGKTIDGKDVWSKYEEIIQCQNEDFVKNKIAMNEIQGLMSLFSFSIFPNGKDYETFRTYGQEKYGFLYLENYVPVYSFKEGINTETFKDSVFL